MNSKFQAGDKAFIIESSIFVKEVYVIKSSGGFCLVWYPNGRGSYRVKESRLYRTEVEAQLVINYNKNNKWSWVYLSWNVKKIMKMFS